MDMSSKELDGTGDPSLVSISIPLEPILDGSADTARTVAGLKAQVFSSRPTKLEQCFANHSEISESYRLKYDAGDRHALRALLGLSPVFIRDQWVRGALEREALSAEPLKRKRGRPSGPTPETLQVGLSLVVVVDQLVKRRVGTVEGVLQDLAERGFEGLSYDRLKKLYYQMRNDPRLRAL